MANHHQPTVRSGDQIPLFDGSNDAQLHSREFLNKIIAVCNAVLRTNQWNITDGGIFFNAPGSGGGGINPRGEYDPTATYAAKDLVVITVGVNQGTYLCLVAGTINILPSTGAPNWMQLPGGLLGDWL